MLRDSVIPPCRLALLRWTIASPGLTTHLPITITFHVSIEQQMSSVGVVKLRRGKTAKYMRDVNTHGDLYAAFQHFVDLLAAKVGNPTLQ